MESSELNFYSHQEEDKNDEEYDMHAQALPVQPFDIHSVDERSIPLTSQEYLQQVIAQRAKLPAVVTASVPKLSSENAQTIVDLFREEQNAPFEHCPSKEWQHLRVSDFSDLRYRIECNRETWKKICNKKFPSCQNDWYQFMFGGLDNSEITQKQPFLNIVLSMNNGMIEKLIKYTVEFVMANKISIYKAGLWFFALLACIEVPLRIKIMKELRTFAQTCRDRRTEINLLEEDSEKELMAQNLFICLIGKYFGQRDLSD